MKQVYSINNLKGIHTVKKDAERVTVGSLWSIEVPAGYSYCADTTMTATDVEDSNYLLQIQKSDDCDFSEGYSSEISVTVRDKLYFLESYHDDATMQMNQFDQVAQQLSLTMGGYEMIRADRSILIGCARDTIFSNSFMYFILTGGSNAVTIMQITFSGDDVSDDKASDFAMQFIDSVEPITVEDYVAANELFSLDSSYLPDFDDAEYVNVEGRFRIPVPKGFECRQPEDSKFKLTIAPNGFDFSEELTDARVSLFIESGSIGYDESDGDIGETTARALDYVRNQANVDWFNSGAHIVKSANSSLVLFSCAINEEQHKSHCPIIINDGESIYFGHICTHFDNTIPDLEGVKFDARIIAASWLSEMLFKGERKSRKESPTKKHGCGLATPDKSLYPHYDHMLNAGPNLPGVITIVNASGTEYEFCSLSEFVAVENDDIEESDRKMIERIIAQDNSTYKMDKEAISMSRLFRVDKETFDNRNDREAEINGGYLKKAYMFSALRSFAWTLADYCDKKKKHLEDIDIATIKDIVAFCANRKWLNYDDRSYCKGLCSGSDLHVYYIPDKTARSDAERLLPSQEDYDRVEKMKGIIASYNEILSQTQSLEALRESLEYIYPAIKLIYEELEKVRDTSKPLEGNEADILYAWCVLAIAAKEPFFTEDGPMTCFFEQLDDEPSQNDSAVAGNIAEMTEGESKVEEKPILRKKGNIDRWGFVVEEVPEKRKKLIDNQFGYPIRFLLHDATQKDREHDRMAFQYYCSLHCRELSDKVNKITECANKYVGLFSADEKNAEIKAGKLRNSAPIHALRSFVWTATEVQGNKLKNNFPSDAPDEMWIDLAAFIGMRGYANYKPVSKNTKRFGAALLRKEEVRSIYSDGCGFDNTPWLYQDDGMGKTMTNASLSSLFQVIELLEKTIPVMEIYYRSLSEKRNLTEGEIKSMETILTGWSVFAFASRQPFFIVPGDYCTEDASLTSGENWAVEPASNEIDGRFVVSGTELIEIKDCGEEVFVPEGITGAIINDDTRAGFETGFKDTEIIHFPKSYVGPIIIPPNVREISMLGDCEIFRFRKLSEETPKLERLKFLGKVRIIKNYAFGSLNNLREINLPEGVEIIRSLAFFGWECDGKITLPESVSVVEDNVFSVYGENNISLYAFKSCPAINDIRRTVKELKEAIEERNRVYSTGINGHVELIELESPWITRSETFVSKIGDLYDEGREEITEKTIREILLETVGGFEYYLKCKTHIVANADENNRPSITGLIKASDDDQHIYVTLPEKLAEDINQEVVIRIKKENKRKIKEAKDLSQSNDVEKLNKAIAILEELKSDGINTNTVIQQISSKLERAKDAEYQRAESLAREGTVSSIGKAIDTMTMICPYKDSRQKAAEYRKLIAKAQKYTLAVSMMYSDDLKKIESARSKFEELDGFSDSAIKAKECADRFKLLSEIERLESVAHQLRLRRSNLDGMFKKKKRLEVEKEIEETEKELEKTKALYQSKYGDE